MSEIEESKVKSKFEALLDAGTNRMLSGLGAYHIWKWMEISRNLNAPGGKKTVDRNLEIMNRHNIFFMQLRMSMYKSFVADLSIFFDKNGYDDNFSIEKLLGSTKDKSTDAQVDEMRKEIEKVKRDHGVTIGLIQELRNADVAHQEINAQPRRINYASIENLFQAVQEILNLVSQSYEISVHWWNHVEQEIDRQMHWIMDNLERGEAGRLEEIKKGFPL